MRSIIFHLLKDPQALKTVLVELDQAYAAGDLTIPVRYSDAAKLPFFVACVKEGMRIHPSVGLQLSRHPPPEGCELAGRFFPRSTRVGINPAVVHFDKGIFGQDAGSFNPSRWLKKDAAHMEVCICRMISLLVPD